MTFDLGSTNRMGMQSAPGAARTTPVRSVTMASYLSGSAVPRAQTSRPWFTCGEPEALHQEEGGVLVYGWSRTHLGGQD